MTRRGMEIRVGIVVLLASAILIVGVMWFQKFRLVEKRYPVFARFDQVGGLQADDPIFVDGVERGRVESVTLGGSGVVVGLAIREGVVLPVDSRVQLESVGIMGERFVAVTRGRSPRALAPGDTVAGEYMMGLSEVMGGAGRVLDDLAATTKHLRSLVEAVSRDGALRSGIEDLSAAGASLRAMTAENEPKLSAAIEGLERVSTRVDSLVERHYASLDSTLSGAARAGRNLDSAAENLLRTSEDLRDITARLSEGKGTMGKLLSDDEFIDRLNATVLRLDSLITDIKLHPGRYMTLELF